MPIEIKEMHIKINVDSDKNSQSSDSSSDDNSSSVLDQCIEQMNQILKNKKER